jgi:hypothetical protein
MKKSSTILLILLGLCQLIYAQTIKFDLGPEITLNDEVSLREVVGSDAQGFYVVSTKSKEMFGSSGGVFVHRFDNGLHQTVYSELKMPDTKGNKVNFEGLSYINKKLSLYSSFYNKSKDMNYAFVNSVSERGIVANDTKSVDEIKATKKKNRGSFDFVLSNDSSKVLVYHNEPYVKGQKERYSLKLMDTEYNLLWERLIELPYKDDKFAVTSYLVSNEGEVFLLGYLESDKKSKRKPNEMYKVITYNHKENKVQEYNINIDKFITASTFKINQKGDIICAGFYANDNKVKDDARNLWYCNGIFTLTIDGKTKAIKNQNFKDFDTNVLEILTGKAKAQKNKGLPAMNFKDIELRTDGGIILIAEQSWVKIVSSKNITNYYYNRNHILVSSINPDGTFAWTTVVSKKQMTLNDGGYFSSYVSGIYGDKIFFVFNENPKNLMIKEVKTFKDIKKMKKMVKPSSSIPVVVSIDSKGDMEKAALMKFNKEKYILSPTVSKQINDNEIVVFTEKLSTGKQMLRSSLMAGFEYNSKIRFGKISFSN